jgi:hypothetical protein
MTISEFLDRHTSRELAEIEARNRIDPYDHIGRIELAIAKVCALLFNANRDREKSEAMSAAAFLPEFGKEYWEQDQSGIETDPEEAIAKVRNGFARFRET